MGFMDYLEETLNKVEKTNTKSEKKKEENEVLKEEKQETKTKKTEDEVFQEALDYRVNTILEKAGEVEAPTETAKSKEITDYVNLILS